MLETVKASCLDNETQNSLDPPVKPQGKVRRAESDGSLSPLEDKNILKLTEVNLLSCNLSTQKTLDDLRG